MIQAEALLLSIALEVPCLILVARRRGWSTASAAQLARVGGAATLLSHPLVWHGSRALMPFIEGFWVRAALTEIGACLFEAVLYRWLLQLSAGRALGVSIAANALSFGIGLVWFHWLRALI